MNGSVQIGPKVVRGFFFPHSVLFVDLLSDQPSAVLKKKKKKPKVPHILIKELINESMCAPIPMSYLSFAK